MMRPALPSRAAAAVRSAWPIHAVLLVQLSHCVSCIPFVTRPLIKPSQNAVSNRGRLETSLNHFFKESNSDCHVANLHAAIYQRVVEQLVTAEIASLDGLCSLQRFVKLTGMTVALQHCGESDEVWLEARFRSDDLTQEHLR